MITKEIINEGFVVDNITEIITSSILLNSELEVLAASRDVLQLLGYQERDIQNTNIYELLDCQDDFFAHEIESFRTNGYFKSKNFTIHDKYVRKIQVEISGFYLGIFSDYSDYIILTIKDIQGQKTFEQLLDNKVSDFNELVYRTYHDLRGPTATIEGLVNISDYSEDPQEYRKLFNLIKTSNDLLNERIQKISQIFEHNFQDFSQSEHWDKRKLAQYIKHFIFERNEGLDVHVEITRYDIDNQRINFGLIQKTIRYAILAFLSYHKSKSESIYLNIGLEYDCNNLIFDFEFGGFVGASHYFIKAMDEKNGFSEIIKNSNAINFYLLQDLFMKYRGIFIPLFDDAQRQQFKIALEM